MTPREQQTAPKIFLHWSAFLGWLLPRTEKFPKRVAMTFRTRIDNLGLDMVELLVEARYCKDREPLLVRANLLLEKLRLLLRLAHEQRLLDEKAHLHACEQIDIAGRMIGGWLRQQRAAAAAR